MEREIASLEQPIINRVKRISKEKIMNKIKEKKENSSNCNISLLNINDSFSQPSN